VAESRRPGDVHAAAAQLFHEVAHCQSFADVFRGVELAARIQGVCLAFDDQRGEGNVGGDHQVAGLHVLDDALVGDVETGGHLARADVRRGWYAQHLIGDQRGHDARPLRGAKEDFLDHAGAGVGVNPDLHSLPLS
jgi:hypothetical protein